MKKNKILIPALAVLAFSTVASVTGTVAWFSAASAVDINTSEFEVTGIDGSLNYSITPLIGVKLGGTDNKTVMAKTDTSGDVTKTATLTHASFDHNTKKVYSKSQEGTGFVEKGTIGSNTDDGTYFVEDASVLKYNCFAWKITFTYGTSGPTDGNRNLYFNVDANVSKIAVDSTHKLNDNAKNAGRGFRMAFLSDRDTSSPMIWSPESGAFYSTSNTPATTGTASKYVNGTASTNTANYTTGSNGELLFKGDSQVQTIAAETKGATDRKDFMGAFTSSINTINITIVCWFDGCDDVNVINETSMPTVSATMNFYMRKSQ